MGVKLRISHGKIFLDIYMAGRRKWESTGLSVSSVPQQQKEIMRLAEIIRSKRETQIVSEKYNILNLTSGKTTLYTYITKYAQTLSKNHPLRTSIKHLENYPGGKAVKITEITPAWVENYRTYLLQDCKLGKTAASNYFNCLRQTLNKAVRENIITRSPATAIKPIKRSDPDRIFLTEPELQKLGSTPPPKNHGTEIKRAFIFSCYTGLRISDIKTLKWKHIHHTDTETRLAKRQQKTDNHIYNPITEDAWKLLNYQGEDPESPVFTHLGSVTSDCRNILTEWGTNAKLNKKVSWHVARRTFAMRLLETGTDLYTISKLLGHTDIKTTQAYLKVSLYLEKSAISNIREIKISDSETPQPSPSTHNQPPGDSETQNTPSPHAENTPTSPPAYNKESCSDA
jgi:site-specific recombinase XerD